MAEATSNPPSSGDPLPRVYKNLELNDFAGVVGDVHGGLHIHGAAINAKVAGQTTATTYSAKSLRPVATYVARPTLHKQLEDRLHTTIDTRGHSSKIVVVCGLGGAGKSQLALHYVQTYRKDYAGVFWIEAGSTAALERDYVQVWRLTSSRTEEKVSVDEAVQGVKAWLYAQEKIWLLVFDSADNIDDESDENFVDLEKFVPDAPGVDVIVTTRSQTAKDITDIEEVQVGDMDKDEALELLLSSSKIKNPTQAKKDEAVLIVKELGHFALAVALAAAYIASTPRVRSNLELYLQEYRLRRKELLARKAQGHVHRYGESVLTTWETSYAAIASQRPEALGLLRLLAYLSPDDIFYELFDPLLGSCSVGGAIWGQLSVTADGSDAITRGVLDDTFEILSRYSMLAWKDEQDSFAMHKLVHTWSFDRMEGTNQALYGQEALCFVQRLLASEEYAPVMKDRLAPHIMACFTRLQEWYSFITQTKEKTLQSLKDLSDFLQNSGLVNQEAVLCQFRCTKWREEREPDDEEVLAAEHALALVHMKLGRWREAEASNSKVMETRRRVLGAEHPDTLTSMANLASTYRNQGRWTEAEELFVKVMETSRRVLGAEHPDTLTSMANLASTYSNQGRWTEAEELEVKVMETRWRVLGAEHPDTLTSMANLASTFWNQGRWTEAEELEVKVMETRRRVLGAEHPDTLTSMANLASTYRNQGRWTEAEELEVKVMETRRRVLGAEHPDTLTSMANLASTYRNQGRWTEAEELEVKVMETRWRVLGAEHPDTLTSMANLASTYRNQGRWTEAEELEVKVMETSRRVLGAEHPSTLTSMANMASTYRNQGRWSEAEELDVKVMETRRRVLGAEHPSTLTSMANLASTFWNQGRWTEAEELFVKVMETRRRVLGAEHPSTLTSMNNLAATYYNQQRLQEALDLAKECLTLQAARLGATHPHSLSTKSWVEGIEEAMQTMDVDATMARLAVDDV